MASEPLRNQWHIDRPIAEVTWLLMEAGYSVVKRDDDGERQLKRDFGKQAVGGLLEYVVSTSTLAITAEVTLQSVSEEETTVNIVVSERGSWATKGTIRFGLHKRYLKAFQEASDQVRTYLEAAPRRSA